MPVADVSKGRLNRSIWPNNQKNRDAVGGWTPWASRDGSVMFMYQRTLSPGAVCFALRRNLPRVGSVGVAVVTRGTLSAFIQYGRAYRKPTSINPIKKSTGLRTIDAVNITEFTTRIYTWCKKKKIAYIPWRCLFIRFGNRVVDFSNLEQSEDDKTRGDY